MARIRIDREETIKRRLPPLCMECGSETNRYILRRFSWTPGWVMCLIFLGLLPLLIGVLVCKKRMAVESPMCDEHQDHWESRSLRTWAGFFLVLAAGILFLILHAVVPPEDAGESFGGYLIGAFVIAFVGWLVYAAILSQSSIRPDEITEYDITLIKLSPEFVRALEDNRAELDEKKYEQRRQRRTIKQREEEDVYDMDSPQTDRLN